MTMVPQAGSSFFLFFLEILFKSALVLLPAVLVTALLKEKSAALRHFILATAMIGLLFLPFFSTSPLSWRADFLPSFLNASNHTTETGLIPSDDRSTSAYSQQKNDRSLFHKSLSSASSYSLTNGVSSRFSSRKSMAATSAIILFWIWATGMIFLLFRMGVGFFEASKMTKSGQPVSDRELHILLKQFLSAVGMTRAVRLKSHRQASVPLTWGLVRPVILVPTDYGSWSFDQKTSALFHELSHIKRWDFFINCLVRLSVAFYWFNPLSWFIYRRLRSEQEKACDEMVLKAGIKPSTYASNLLLFKKAAGIRFPPPAEFVGMFGRSSFHERMSAILKQKFRSKEINMKTKIVIIGLILLLVAVVGTARPSLDQAIDAELSVNPGLTEETSPSPPVEETPPVQEKQEKEKNIKKIEKIKKGDKDSIIISVVTGEKNPIEITIIENGKEKILSFDKPITIKKDEDGNLVLMDSDGKTFHLGVKDGDIKFYHGEKAFVVGGKDGISWTAKEGEDEKEANVFIVSEKDAKFSTYEWKDKDGLFVHVEPGDKEHMNVWTVHEDDLKKDIEKIRENLNKLQAEDTAVQEIKKSLNELEEKLNKQNALHLEGWVSKDEPKLHAIIEKSEGEESKNELYFTSEKGTNKMSVFISEGGEAQVMCSLGDEKNASQIYENVIAVVKKELPEGWTMESEFDTESGVIKIKFKGMDKEEDSKGFLKRLGEIIKEASKK
ncbi:MAG: M56 family metallopeptidase [Candidatus Aminicenantes bacterium]|nr:M56 family metallopeptidase [Candidatus Aminicenantes bacterium]